ncbi:hypothetical protein F2Q69_00048410 [Brassica cretica]|uniref:Uncharacterized protein n=1 Tax=Brassica cretica TaxID=69181 RepID=A0A8S9Q253_BRACR|nr:hypothetical protein F2Q69_00048410 [Brassica cretica]
MPFETSSKHLFHWDIKPMSGRGGLSLSSKVVVLLTMAYVFLGVYSEGSSGRVDQCGIPERPLDCEPLYVSEMP